MLRRIRRLLQWGCLGFASLLCAAAMAAKPGGGGGGGCTDAYPSFAYEASGGAVMLSSANGCRRDVLLAANPDRRHWAIDFTADRQSGVLVWSDDPGNAARYVVRRLSFSVADGTLVIGAASNVLPLPGEVVPAGHQIYYRPVLWGTADHSSLFLSTYRTEIAADGVTDVSRQWLVYDLKNLALPARVVFNALKPDGSRATWGDCTGVVYRQFVANCHQVGQNVPRFSPAGRRFYFDGMVTGWQSALRLDIGNLDAAGNVLPLADWTFGAPALVATAPRGVPASYVEVNLWGVRPELDGSGAPRQPIPEHAGLTYIDRTGKQTVRNGLFIDADRCVQEYIHRGLTGGTIPGPEDLWRTDCPPANPLYDAFAAEPWSAWQSADTVLQEVAGRRNTFDIHRRHVAGGFAGTSELLIQGGRFPRTGF